MATATATKIKTTRNGTSAREAKPERAEAQPETMTMEAEITSGIFKGKMVDLTFSSDGSNAHMSDPKLTPEERVAWDAMMQACREAVETARELNEQNVESIKLMKQIQARLKGDST